MRGNRKVRITTLSPRFRPESEAVRRRNGTRVASSGGGCPSATDAPETPARGMVVHRTKGQFLNLCTTVPIQEMDPSPPPQGCRHRVRGPGLGPGHDAWTSLRPPGVRHTVRPSPQGAGDHPHRFGRRGASLSKTGRSWLRSVAVSAAGAQLLAQHELLDLAR